MNRRTKRSPPPTVDGDEGKNTSRSRESTHHRDVKSNREDCYLLPNRAREQVRGGKRSNKNQGKKRKEENPLEARGRKTLSSASTSEASSFV